MTTQRYAMNYLNPKIIRDEITALLLAHPELEEDEVLRADSVEGETGAFEFISSVLRQIGSTKSTAAGTADYIGELQERKHRLERREDALRLLIFKIMQSADLKKAELPEATVSVRNGAPKVVITNEREIPMQYMRIKSEPDKTKLKAVLVEGGNVPGAMLSNGEPTIAILVK